MKRCDRLWVVTAVAASLTMLAPADLHGATITEYSAGITEFGSPTQITRGPDGNLWFTEQNGHRVGRITRAGVITEFSAGISAGANPGGITAGPDGNLWFTEGAANKIGRITPAGVVTEFSEGITAGASPTNIVAGSDGNLWFTSFYGYVGKMTPSGIATELPVGGLFGIANGPDGNLWCTETFGSRIARITPAGVVTWFSAGITPGSFPTGIAAGPDGNLWFTEQNSKKIGRITQAGVVTEFAVASRPFGIAPGPDGNVWFAEPDADRVGRITPDGVITEFSVGITPGSSPSYLATGLDGNIWFTEFMGDRIARLTGEPGLGSEAAQATRFQPVAPCRLFDTRLAEGPQAAAPALGPGETRTFFLDSRCGLSSSTVLSLSVNQTVTGSEAAGELVLFRSDLDEVPVSSYIVYRAGKTRANNGIVGLSRTGDGSFKVHNRSAGKVHFILDVNGTFQ